ncbi:hypothetical protein EDD37DRAFT_649164 [Exophiala viscosa]|uniref:Uncharacterized protein n=1 Tax=Exophiala viscosa TaxID=2486360 RepID=A0AAN6DUK2_9EURO|nr:hypothetical protein EDD36DRAFT_312601 [Exophiala viscosa]KAI1624826.1 hypothetical protein EDD37DRAFT_649164 [Exophiala viscosa]
MAPQLPPYLAHFADLYNAYIHPLLPTPLQSISGMVTPFLNSAIAAAASGDIVSLAAFVVTIYFTVRMADYLRRSVVAWVVFGLKIVMVIAAVNVAFYVNSVGVQKALGDAEWVVGLVWGFVEDKVTNSGGSEKTGGPFGYYGGGRQQVPLTGGKKKAGGWR